MEKNRYFHGVLSNSANGDIPCANGDIPHCARNDTYERKGLPSGKRVFSRILNA